ALASIVLWSSSCLKLQRPDNSEKEAEIAQAMEKFVLTESVTVEVPEGKLAVVTLKGTTDTIAILPMTASIMVPSASAFAEAETKAKGDPSIDVNIINPTGGTNVPEGAKFAGFSYSYFTLAFEDSFVGDYDYNDLVLEIRLDNRKIEGKKAPYTLEDFIGRLHIKPIACGSRNKIGFGIRIGKNGEDILLTDDVRRDYFDGAEGFINTASWQNGIMNFDVREIYSQTGWIGDLYFFIAVGNYHLYAANTNIQMLDKNKCPYGIIVSSVTGNDTEVYGKLTPEDEVAQREEPTKESKFKCRTWWRYPYESVSIDEAYPRNKEEGWFTFLINKPTTLAEVCYFGRAKEGKVFPSIAYREDGTLDPEKTVYYGKIAK
ncbi:MAG: hypothetical protein KIG45_03785, partial [Bacteroidales bacterium]|nr:hypothetical protein [Bacteroidales bacterium]